MAESWWGGGHVGTTRRGNAYATEPATAATGMEAPPPQGTPSAAATAAGGDGASLMEAAGAPMVNADDAGECSSQSESDEDEEQPLRLGALAAIYWAVKHTKPDELPTQTHGLDILYRVHNLNLIELQIWA